MEFSKEQKDALEKYKAEYEATRPEREKLRLQQDKKEFDEVGKIAYHSENKSELEIRRYKQDCRKRALDLANMEAPRICLKGEWIPSSDDITKKADKYYEWLTKDLS